MQKIGKIFLRRKIWKNKLLYFDHLQAVDMFGGDAFLRGDLEHSQNDKKKYSVKNLLKKIISFFLAFREWLRKCFLTNFSHEISHMTRTLQNKNKRQETKKA